MSVILPLPVLSLLTRAGCQDVSTHPPKLLEHFDVSVVLFKGEGSPGSHSLCCATLCPVQMVEDSGPQWKLGDCVQPVEAPE